MFVSPPSSPRAESRKTLYPKLYTRNFIPKRVCTNLCLLDCNSVLETACTSIRRSLLLYNLGPVGPRKICDFQCTFALRKHHSEQKTLKMYNFFGACGGLIVKMIMFLMFTTYALLNLLFAPLARGNSGYNYLAMGPSYFRFEMYFHSRREEVWWRSPDCGSMSTSFAWNVMTIREECLYVANIIKIKPTRMLTVWGKLV